uniref:DUF3168 domain-containing protein n=1 Tax=Dulem virus 40 TaxID=3145758 RepID=A0AAU8AWG4_9CAUD
MSAIVYPRMEVLQSLYELTADITPNRFITTRPNAVGEQMEEFLLIRISQSMDEWGNVCQFSTGQIAVFARDVQGGLENTLMLERMQSAVMGIFGKERVINTPIYTAWEPRLLPGGSDSAGFHSLIIQFRLQIK